MRRGRSERSQQSIMCSKLLLLIVFITIQIQFVNSFSLVHGNVRGLQSQIQQQQQQQQLRPSKCILLGAQRTQSWTQLQLVPVTIPSLQLRKSQISASSDRCDHARHQTILFEKRGYGRDDERKDTSRYRDGDRDKDKYRDRDIDDDEDYYYDDDEDYYYDDDDDFYEDDEEEEPLEWEWETYQKTTHIYLPPPPSLSSSSSSNRNNEQNFSTSASTQTQPKTIIHFIGGTLFGSYPLQFYKEFLEQIAEKSNSIIVATSIPVTFQSNPLNHYKLCYNIVKAFRGAYKDVICDEYGINAAKGMDIVGMGHSLGSRLHCVISTDDDDDDDDVDGKDEDNDNIDDDYDMRRRKRRQKERKNMLQKIGLKRKGNILVAFNNYSALSSVPGVQSLEKGVRETRKEEMEMRDRIEEQRKRSKRNYEKRYGKQRGRNQMYDDYDDYFDDDDDDDLELKDIVTSIKSSLTPDIKRSSLEFKPTPDELWNKMTKSYSKNIEKTLLVQFDKDGIDQSARLAQVILDSTSSIKDTRADLSDSTSSSTATVDEKKSEEEDMILFARLRGTHLSPVSYSDSFGLIQAWKQISNVPMDDLLKEAIDEDERSFNGRAKRKGSSASQKKNNFDDLTSSIARYITDIIS